MSHPNTDQWIATALILTAVAGVFWIVPHIRYVIDERFLRVMLGGITLRKIALSDIEYVDTKAPVWNEHWCNCFKARERVVRIRRKSGIVRNFIITPADRVNFIEDLNKRLGSPV